MGLALSPVRTGCVEHARLPPCHVYTCAVVHTCTDRAGRHRKPPLSSLPLFPFSLLSSLRPFANPSFSLLLASFAHRPDMFHTYLHWQRWIRRGRHDARGNITQLLPPALRHPANAQMSFSPYPTEHSRNTSDSSVADSTSAPRAPFRSCSSIDMISMSSSDWLMTSTYPELAENGAHWHTSPFVHSQDDIPHPEHVLGAAAATSRPTIVKNEERRNRSTSQGQNVYGQQAVCPKAWSARDRAPSRWSDAK